MITRFCFVAVILLTLASCSKRITSTQIHEEEGLSEMERVEYEYVLNEAIRYKLLGHIDEAEKLFLRCFEINPDSHVPLYELANIYYFSEDYEKALEFSKKAINTDKTNKWYYIQLAQFYYQKDNIEGAIQVYELMLENVEPDVEPLYILAQLYFENTQFNEGLEIYEIIEGIIGIDHEIIHDKKEVYIYMGEYELAYNQVLRLINAYPEDMESHLMLADLYSRIGMHEEAKIKYMEILEHDEINIKALINLVFYKLKGEEYNEAIKYISRVIEHDEIETERKNEILFSSFEYLNINKYFNELENILSKIEYTEEDSKQTYAVTAEFYIRSGKYNEALKYIYKLIDKEQDNYYFREQLLFVLSYIGDHETILEESEEALRYFPEDPIILYFNGFANYILENTEKAKASFYKCINHLSDEEIVLSAQVHAYIGEIYNKEENYIKSDKYFRESINLDSTNLTTLNNYAYFLTLREEKLDLAEKLSRKAVDGDPVNYAFLDTYAWVMYNMKDYQTALIFIEKAYINNGSENSEILEHYGDILIKSENVAEAVEKWKRAIELGGNKKIIEEKINKTRIWEKE